MVAYRFPRRVLSLDGLASFFHSEGFTLAHGDGQCGEHLLFRNTDLSERQHKALEEEGFELVQGEHWYEVEPRPVAGDQHKIEKAAGQPVSSVIWPSEGDPRMRIAFIYAVDPVEVLKVAAEGYRLLPARLVVAA